MAGRRILSQRGLALVLVLWTLTLVTVIVASFSAAMRVETKMASNLVEHSRAGALAEAGIRIGIARLLEADSDNRWTVDGAPYDAEIDAHRVTIRLRSEHGKIDLNRSAESVIRSLIEHVAGEGDDPDPIADALLDWRDTNRNRRLRGAEDPAYESEGRDYGARDGPFVSTAELTQVLGIDAALAERLAPLVTVYSGRPQIDPSSASREVLMALPGASADHVDAFLEARAAAANGGPPASSALIPLRENVLSAPTAPRQAVSGTFTVSAQARVGQARAAREVVVRTRVARARSVRSSRRAVASPFTIVAWSDTITGEQAGVSEPSGEDAPAGTKRSVEQGTR